MTPPADSAAPHSSDGRALSPFQRPLWLQAQVFGQQSNQIGGSITIRERFKPQRFEVARHLAITSREVFSRRLDNGDAEPRWSAPQAQPTPVLRIVDCREAARQGQAAVDALLQVALANTLPALGSEAHRAPFHDVVGILSDGSFSYATRFDHLSIDGWGISQCFRDLASAYAGGSCGADLLSARTEAEHVLREKLSRYPSSSAARRDQSFWLERQTEAADIAKTSASNARAPSSLHSEDGGQWLQAAADAAAMQGVSLQAWLMASLFQSLHEVLGRNELLMGVVFHNRPGIHQKLCVEPLMHVLPLPMRLDEASGLAGRALGVMRRLRGAYRHAFLPVGHHLKVNGLSPEFVLNLQSLRFSESAWGAVASARLWHTPIFGAGLALTATDYGDGQDSSVHLDHAGDAIPASDAIEIGNRTISLATHGDFGRVRPVFIQPATKAETGGDLPSAGRPFDAATDGPGLVQATDVQDRVAALFSRALGGSEVDGTSDFFLMGGDSFSMLQLLAEVTREFKVSLPVQNFLDGPTINGVTAFVCLAASNSAAQGPASEGGAAHAPTASADSIAAELPGGDVNHLAVRFHAIARQYPNRIALRYEGEGMSYGELAQRANTCAKALLRRGVTQGALVGICLDRKPELIVAILGVMQAGCAYVPLDPAYPEERLRQVVRSAGLRAIISDEEARHLMSWFDGTLIVDVKDDPGPSNHSLTLAETDLAYVIFTSGSTGLPKGVMITHANVLRLYGNTKQWFEFSERDVFALYHSTSFDSSVWEIFGALLHGGTLVLVPYWVTRTPELFIELLMAERVSVLTQTPTAFRLLLSEAPNHGARMPGALRLIMIGGEVLPQGAVNRWIELFGNRTRLANLYGPTEITVFATRYDIPPVVVHGHQSVPIGTPVPDLCAQVLDESDHEVPDGVTGELHIGGPGLAVGYLGDAERTAKRFILARGGLRLYRTGDLVYREAGNLYFVGRNDSQAKIRGHRIDLTEIEAALRHALPGCDCVALVDEGAAMLVGFYVPRQTATPPDVSQALQDVARKLPRHAVPSRLVRLEALPLTPNGKLDHLALLTLGRAVQSVPEDGTAEPPEGPLEGLVADCIQGVLGGAAPSRHRSFFELGGDSLKAVELRGVLAARGIHLSMKEIFQDATIKGLAETAGSAREGSRLPDQGVMAPYRAEGLHPAAFAQLGMMLHIEAGADVAAFNVPVHLVLGEALDTATLERRLQRMVDRHAVLRTTFQWTPRGLMQNVLEQQEARLHQLDLAEASQAAVHGHLDELSNRGWDLHQGPLFAFHMTRTATGRVLSLIFHHLIVDGVSLPLLAKDLLSVDGAPVGDGGWQFSDFARWQQRWVRSPGFAASERFWAAEWQRHRPPTRLPACAPAYGEHQPPRAAHLERRVPLALVRRAQARLPGITLMAFCLGLFVETLRENDPALPVVLGAVSANRTHPNALDVVGPCANMLLLVFDLPAPLLVDRLGAINRHFRQCVEHQDAPFEYLNAKFKSADPRSRPFHIAFAAQNRIVTGAMPQGQAIQSLLDLRPRHPKYDILLECHEAGEALVLQVEYDCSRHCRRTIDALADGMVDLLEDIAGTVNEA